MDNINLTGELLHSTSNELYLYHKEHDLEKRNGQFLGAFIIFMVPIIISIFTYLDSGIIKVIWFEYFFIFMGMIILWGSFEMWAKSRVDRLKVYENGLSTPTKPLKFIYRDVERFIPFSSIDKIKYTSSSGYLNLKLKDGSAITIRARDDFKGFQVLSVIFNEMYPNVPAPNLDVIRDFINAHSKYLYGEVSKSEYLQIMHKMMETNAMFDRN